MSEHEFNPGANLTTIFSERLDQDLVHQAEESGADTARLRVQAMKILSTLHTNTAPNREGLKPVVVQDKDSFHVEVHDEFGFAGFDPSMEELMQAALAFITEGRYGSANNFYTDEVVRFYEYLKTTTENFHSDLAEVALKGAGAMSESGHFKLPKIEKIDPIDQHAMFALYAEPGWGGVFPKSALLKVMKRSQEEGN